MTPVEQADVDLETLVARIEHGELLVGDPSPAWDERCRQRLVDSILRGWHVPAVHVAGHDWPERVLDGRSRLLTLAQFLHDDLPCGGWSLRSDDPLSPFAGMRFGDLPAPWRRRVRRFRIPVVTHLHERAEERAEMLERLGHRTPAPYVPRTAAPELPKAPEIPTPREAPTPRPRPGRAPAPDPSAGPSFEPIYEQLSAWFTETSENGAADGLPPAESVGAGAGAMLTWGSAGDEGGTAARAAADSALARTTESGLPRREPAAHLVPGSAPRPRDGRTGNDGPPRPDAHTVADRLSRYQDGTAGRRRPSASPAPRHHSVFDEEP